MMMQVAVFAPVRSAQKTDWGGSFKITVKEDFRYGLIGFLPEFTVEEYSQKELGRMHELLKPYGLDPCFMVVPISTAPGYLGCHVCIGVQVDDLDVLKTVCFTHILDFSGGYYSLENFGDNLTFSDGHLPKRVKCPKEMNLPKYRDDGSFVFTLIPNGQIGNIVFLKDDSTHYYICRTVSDADAVKECRTMYEGISNG